MPLRTLPELLGEHDQHGVELIHLHTPATSVSEVSEALGVVPRQLVKALVVETDESPLLALVFGHRKLSIPLLNHYLRVRQRPQAVRLYPSKRLSALTGYPMGSLPPINLGWASSVVIDTDRPDSGFVFGGGGAPTTLLRLDISLLISINKAEPTPISE